MCRKYKFCAVAQNISLASFMESVDNTD